MSKFVSSLSNPRVRDAAALNRNRGRKKSGMILFDGVREAIKAVEAGVSITDLFFCPILMSQMEQNEYRVLNSPGFLAEATEVIEVSPEVMGKISYREKPAGVAAVAFRPELRPEDFICRVSAKAEGTGRDPILLVVEGAEKPGNVGAVFRTADCAGVTGVILADSACDPFNPNSIRASLGCVFTVPLLECSTEGAIDLLTKADFRIMTAVVDGGLTMWEADLTGRVAIAMGSEKDGLTGPWRQSFAQGIRIPMNGAADSLNLAMAAGLILYEAFRQRTVC